jgi:RNA 3'-terminal phosphate cyclase (ATP)
MRGVTSEAVALDAIEQAKRYLVAGVPVCSCLADQLLLPMAMSGGGSFTTLPLTRHSSTNINIIRRFLPVTVDVTREDAHRCRVQISGAGAS